MPNSNNQQNSSGSGVRTAAAVGFGAVLGALAAGAAWYFTSDEESRSSSQRHEVYHTSHPVHRPSQPLPTANNDTDKDEKDGTIKMCEVCFVSFEELKECGVQIVSTPCGHVYCRDCIVGALQVKPECPHCRGEVEVHNLRRLYL
ncbi:unnamed protein product [Orchesella dallaii]|uniref:RING-type domain-containing protein n=1 Tax=Orchesella dallaii TaxID=48710 RepID=A0ABP1QGV5_9HEXA